MTKKIVIYYFPAGMRYGSWALLPLSAFLIWQQAYIWSAVLPVVFLIILSTRYVTEIDPQRKAYADYVFFLGLRLGIERSRYDSIRGITISRSSETTQVRSRVQDRRFNWTAYTATLHFDDGQTLDLVTSVSYEAVKGEALGYAEFLGTEVLSG